MFDMVILIVGIVVGVCFLVYMAWIYIKSSVFVAKGFINDEKEIRNVPMRQFFHFNCFGEINDK